MTDEELKAKLKTAAVAMEAAQAAAWDADAKWALAWAERDAAWAERDDAWVKWDDAYAAWRAAEAEYQNHCRSKTQ
jgi:hypothetical protein